MKRFVKTIFNIFLVILIIASCTACAPPLIDGLVDANEYFFDTVQCVTYAINPEADSGFETAAGLDITLEDITDSDETNISMQRYLSFVFKAEEEIKLATVAFVVETQEDAELVFQLETDTLSFTQSITMATGSKGIVCFSDLELLLYSSDVLTITLTNPLLSNVLYRIDTVIFTI